MSVIKGIHAGVTDITSTYIDSHSEQDTQTIEVIRIQIGRVSDIESVLYTGEEIFVYPDVFAIVDGKEVKLENNRDYNLSYINNIKSGTATVIVEGVDNFTGIVEKNWTISNADIEVSANDQSCIYNGSMFGNSISAIGIGDVNITIRYGLIDGVYNLDSAPQIKNVSDSKIIYYQITAPNHNNVVGSYELSITPKTAELHWGESSWIYDGRTHSTTCDVSNLIGDDKCDVNMLYNSITNIGSIDVYASSLSNSNYTLPSDGLWYTITITPGMFYKIGDNWTPVKAVYRKVNGTWVKQEFANAFSEDENYLKK